MKLTGFESNKINSEMVNHPSHYNLPDRKECIDEMIDIYGLKDVAKWCEITAYKYKYRAGHKGSVVEDMSKAAWYIIKARELKSKRRWKVFGKFVDKELPVLIKNVFLWLMMLYTIRAVLLSDERGLLISVVFLALATITESLIEGFKDN
jgi:hypothetical protein